MIAAAAVLVAAMLLPASPASAQSTSAPARSTQSQGHAGHGGAQENPKPKPPAQEEHQKPAEQKPYPPGIPPITDEDRAAAFPELNGQHTVHDRAVHYFVLFDQIEWQGGSGVTAFGWDNQGWIGQDVNRFWFRTEAGSEDGRLAGAEAHALYGRAIARWWDLVVGLRQDVRPGPARTWAAVGIQGLAPYWFEVEATAYVGEGGRTHFRLETKYELRLTNRLILQPLVEVDIFGKSEEARGIGAGLSSAEAGVRLRYEWRRELAPYLGVTWNRKFFGTADLAGARGEETGGARLALGVRVWF